jgi:hypothetical protein
VKGTRVRSFLLGALAVGLIAFGSGGTYSSFFSTTMDGSNAFAAGTVHVKDNDAGGVMFNVSGVRPGDAARVSCITVTYDGSLDADVRLYASVSSTGVEQYVSLKVETGTTTSGYGDCSGFSTISTLFNDTLSNYPTGWGSGIAEPGNPWTTGEAHAYRVTVSLQNSAPASAQGKTATVTFRWEARNR